MYPGIVGLLGSGAVPLKRVLITGGSRGLGLAICRHLLAEGWHVVTTSRNPSLELAQVLQEHAGRIEFHPAELAEIGNVAAFCKAARVQDGFAGFVANAGVGIEGLLTLSSTTVIEESMHVNLLAPMLLAREVVKGMLESGGSLVFVSSVAALTGMRGLSVYSAAKGGLVSFSRALAREYGSRGVRSNAILPGFIETSMTESLQGRDRERIIRRTALKRLGNVDDVAGVVSFLLSDAARYVTGTEIVVDGGMTA